MFKAIVLIGFISLLNLYAEDSKLNFSDDELTYLKNKNEIRMCVDPSWMPFESIKKNKHIGMISDVYEYFERNLPIPIKLLVTPTWSQSLQYAKDRKCDILSAAVSTPQRKKYLNFTNPYLKFPQVIVTREKEEFIEEIEDIKHLKIGVVKDSGVAELLKNKYKNINLIAVKNVSEGLFKVSSGELYGFVNTSATVSYAIAKNGMTNLKIASKVGIEYFIRVAIRDDDPLLLNIFNTLIKNINQKHIKEIKNKWVHVKVDEKIDYSIVYKVIAIFSLILIIIAYWNRKLKKEIIQRKKLENELKSQKNQLEMIFSNIPIPILIVSKSTQKILFANNFSAKTYKTDVDKLIGENISVLYTSKNQREDILSSFNEDGLLINYKTRYKINDGSKINALLSIIPIEYENQDANLGIITDVTDLIETQKALKKETKKAQSAVNAKSDFLAKMSHEIRTPMNAILGMLYLIEKTTLDSTQNNYIKKANGAANLLLGIINDILDFSKIEANMLQLKIEEININKLIFDTMSVMSVKASQKELELLASYDKDIPINILSDKLRVSQILNNLISNAIKFTPSGEILVSTKLININKNKATLLFCIKDSGIGIEKKSQDKLFSEFTQADNSITRNFGGTGLGLAISKKLCNMLEGDIWIEESKEGIGTTICFTIKVEISQNKIENKFIFPNKLLNLNILIIDDNKTAIEVLTSMLESFNYTVHSANSGIDALELIKTHRYDLVFLDYKMPHLDGLQTYSKIKEILGEDVPKTILVTAYLEDIVNNKIANTGIQGYLTKPISPSTLYDKIIEVFSNKIAIQSNNKEDLLNTKNLNGIKVLLVEDNLLNQEFAKIMLENNGLIVEIAQDGIDALQKIKTKGFDVVLMDIQMPHMDGLEATKHIREFHDDYFKKIPIIALSANAMAEDREKSLNVGMDEHISKPIDPEKLFDVLGKFVDIQYPTNNEDNQNLTTIIDQSIINTKEAISRIGGNSKAYIKILHQFSIKYKNILDVIYDLKNQNDIENLEHKIHELKGVAGNISANKLFHTLVLFDKSLKENKIPSYQLIKQFTAEFKDVTYEISKLKLNETTKSITFNKAKVIILLDTISKYLDTDIVQCEKYIEDLIPYLEEDYKDFSNKLIEDIENFDTDNAFTLIEEFLKDLNNE